MSIQNTRPPKHQEGPFPCPWAKYRLHVNVLNRAAHWIMDAWKASAIYKNVIVVKEGDLSFYSKMLDQVRFQIAPKDVDERNYRLLSRAFEETGTLFFPYEEEDEDPLAKEEQSLSYRLSLNEKREVEERLAQKVVDFIGDPMSELDLGWTMGNEENDGS